LKWTYNEILTEAFFESLVNLEDTIQKELLVETKIYEVLETAMKVQEIPKDPIQEISQDAEVRNENITEKVRVMKDHQDKRNEEVESLRKKNNATLEEIKKISGTLNYGEQIIIENEEQLGTNQLVPMKICNSIKMKRKKKREKRHRAKVRKRKLYDAVRDMLGESKLTKKKI
jgi:hypothetical protein